MKQFFETRVKQVGTIFEKHPHQAVALQRSTNRALGIRSGYLTVRQEKFDRTAAERTVAGKTEHADLATQNRKRMPGIFCHEWISYRKTRFVSIHRPAQKVNADELMQTILKQALKSQAFLRNRPG